MPHLLPVRSVLVLLICCHCGAAANAQTADRAAERQQAVEHGLVPAVLVEGHPERAFSIHDRMRHYGVPGVSIAVINGGRVEWAEGYGVKQVGAADSVTTSTLFQAASISKTVTALATLALAEEGRVDLDHDVNDYLRAWSLPTGALTAERPVTLRGLLSHTAGLGVPSLPGYPAGEYAPTAVGVLNGEGATPPVRSEAAPCERFAYSGGGYVVAQTLLEDAAGEPFADVVRQSVLDPLRMYQSTFRQPLPARLADDAAAGHVRDAEPVPGRWHTYPEQGAGGLWTTAMDLGRFIVGLSEAYHGRPGAVVNAASVQEMLTPPTCPGWEARRYGLGIGVDSTEHGLVVSHSGGNEGYASLVVAYPATGDGVVVLTNGTGGTYLRQEIAGAVTRAYGWESPTPGVWSVVAVEPAVLDRYVGTYPFDDVLSWSVHVERDGGDLYVTLGDFPRARLLARSDTSFFIEGTGTVIEFGPEERIGELEVWGTRYVRNE